MAGPDSVSETAVATRPWPVTDGVQVAASIYALPPESRPSGALAAHAAGHWVHADIILTPGPDGEFRHSGVDPDMVAELLGDHPEIPVEVHLMVPTPGVGWEDAVAEVTRRLSGVPVRRWTASRPVLAVLAFHLPVGCERWVEIHPARDGTAVEGDEGILVMLIEPGTKGTADLAAVKAMADLIAAGLTVGVDGGVTPDVARRVIDAGGSYIVVGRALWAQGFAN